MSKKYVYVLGMDEYQGPMPAAEAYQLANETNAMCMKLNSGALPEEEVWTVAIVVDSKDTYPPWDAISKD